MKRALISGCNGQDGSYLAEHLLNLGYEVYGIVRRNSVSENQSSRIEHLRDQITTFYGDLTDTTSLEHAMEASQPDEIYNLAAMSHVAISFQTPQYTAQATALGVLNVLESARTICPKARIYQAGSSEMFGNSTDADGKQRESTCMLPVSPYGVAKLYGHHMVRTYRNSYGMFASNGILFNHESPRRGSNFVTQKVVKGAIAISRGEQEELILGNLDASRDWGHAKDYVKAMHLMLQHDQPDDFVVATGKTQTVRDLCQITFSMLGLNYMDHVRQDPKYLRPQELNYLCGDSSKARQILKWKPEYTFIDIIAEMVESELKGSQ